MAVCRTVPLLSLVRIPNSQNMGTCTSKYCSAVPVVVKNWDGYHNIFLTTSLEIVETQAFDQTQMCMRQYMLNLGFLESFQRLVLLSQLM